MPTPEELSLGTLNITVTSHGNDPAKAKFDLPDGSSVTREIPAEGLAMKLGPGLGVSYVKGAAGGGEEFEGPLDLVTGAVAAYSSARALSTDWLGSALYTLRRASDDAELAFNADDTTGDAPTMDISNWLGASGAFVKTWHDHSGNALNVTQSNAAAQVAWTLAAFDGKPSLASGNGTPAEQDGFLASSGNLALPNGAYTVFAVLYIPNTATGVGGITGFGYDAFSAEVFAVYSNGRDVELDATSDGAGTNMAGGLTEGQPLAQDTKLILDCAWEHGSKSVVVNGAAASFVNNYDIAGVPSISDPFAVFRSDVSGGETFGGFVAELIIYPTKLSDPDRALIRQNLATYYGITLP